MNFILDNKVMDSNNPKTNMKNNPGNFKILYVFFASFNNGFNILATHGVADGEEPYPSLSDFHDYEPNLEFDDTELHQPPDANTGNILYIYKNYRLKIIPV